MYRKFYNYNFKKGDIYKFIGRNGINIKNIIISLKQLDYNIQKIHLVNNGVYISAKKKEDIFYWAYIINLVE